MRISDWSSDVCSSDLKTRDTADRHETAVRRLPGYRSPNAVPPLGRARATWSGSAACPARTGVHNGWRYYRSEEHTSELQSLMRISYAVFCLTKKHQPNTTYKHISLTATIPTETNKL